MLLANALSPQIHSDGCSPSPQTDSETVHLTHWGRAKHICVGKLTIIGSDNGLSPGRRQAIIWTIAGILLIGPLGTNFSEILIEIHTFSFMKMHLKMSSAKWRLFCLGVNVLNSMYCEIFNPFSAKTIIIQDNYVKTMAAEPWLLASPKHQ